MTEILILSDDKSTAVPGPLVTQHEAFQKILKRDTTKGKRLATSEFAYIYHTADPRSAYAKYREELRDEKIIEAFLPTGWKPDTVVWEAVKVYKELKVSTIAMLLESAQKGIHKLEKFFEDVDLNAVDKNGRPIYKPTDITGPLKDMGKITAGIQELLDQVNAEQDINNTTRGGHSLNKYSEE